MIVLIWDGDESLYGDGDDSPYLGMKMIVLIWDKDDSSYLGQT